MLQEQYDAFCAAYPPQFVTLNGHRWTYREAGSADYAPTVLLLPGALGRPETSFEYIGALASDFRVLAPGYPATARTITELADGAAALLGACGVEHAHIVGGSFGGLVAQALLARQGERVGRIVLSDTSPPVPHRALRMRILATLIRRLPERFVKGVIGFGVGRYVAALPSTARQFWQGHFHEMVNGLTRNEIEARADAWAEFDRTIWPVVPPHEMLVLGAASDRAVSPRAFLHRFPHAEIHVVASPLGHAASIGDAMAYIAPIRRFLTKGIA